MKFLVISSPSFEFVTQNEIKEHLNIDSTTEKGVVFFEHDNIEEVAKFCYFSQSSKRVMVFLDKAELTTIDNLKLDLPEKFPLIKENYSFCVRCKHVDSETIKSIDIEKKLGAVIHDNYGLPVKLEGSDVIFYATVIENILYFGIDLCSFDISKRDYKIINNPYSIKGTLAFNMLKLAEYNREDILLDPYIKSGEIVIEAACYFAKKSINYYQKNRFHLFEELDIDLEIVDNFTEKVKNVIYGYSDSQKYVQASKKNAKILDVNKMINFSRTDVDWLDTKFDENTITKIITIFSKTSQESEDDFKKKVHEFFHQAEFILKEKGIIVLLTHNPDYFENEHYKIAEKIPIFNKNSYVLKFVRK